MTKRYSDINQHDALYNTARAYPGGIEALAARTGKTPAVMYNKLRPGVESHHASFEEVSEILEYCQQAQVKDPLRALHAMNWRHGLVSFPMTSMANLGDDDLTKGVCRTMKECSDVISTISESLANDGLIDAGELDAIEKEFQEALAAIGELRQRVALRGAKDVQSIKKVA